VSTFMGGIKASPQLATTTSPGVQKWPTIKHFEPWEFDSPDDKGSGVERMSLQLIQLLDSLRERCGFPFIISSGYRSFKYNSTLPNASVQSAHIKGLAVDIVAQTSGEKFMIVKYALEIGIRRVGVGSNFVHLDTSTELPEQMLWTY